jgi:hypothetical protein
MRNIHNVFYLRRKNFFLLNLDILLCRKELSNEIKKDRLKRKKTVYIRRLVNFRTFAFKY